MNKKLSSNTEVLDKLIGGYEDDILTTVYGPASAGKTCICILASIAAVNSGKKVIFVDTEGGFSVERLMQLSPNYKQILENMIFFKPTSFLEQKVVFEKLKLQNLKFIGLIVIDTISMLYRVELGKTDDVYPINRELGKQISWLTEIARKKNIPMLITNQVYSNFSEPGSISMVGGDILRYGSKCLIELKLHKSNRTAVLKKHRNLAPDQRIEFIIKEKGIFFKYRDRDLMLDKKLPKRDLTEN